MELKKGNRTSLETPLPLALGGSVSAMAKGKKKGKSLIYKKRKEVSQYTVPDVPLIKQTVLWVREEEYSKSPEKGSTKHLLKFF